MPVIDDDAPPIIDDTAELKAGSAGTDETVKEMIRLIKSGMKSSDVQEIASSLKSQTKSDLDYFQAAHAFVVRNIEYKNDRWKGKEAEVLASARLTLTGRRPYGDCDDMVIALATLLMLNNMKAAIKVVAWKPKQKDQFTHVYLLGYVPSLNAWIPADPVRDATLGQSGFGWEIAPIFKRKIYQV